MHTKISCFTVSHSYAHSAIMVCMYLCSRSRLICYLTSDSRFYYLTLNNRCPGFFYMPRDGSPGIHGTDRFTWSQSQKRFAVCNVESQVFTPYNLAGIWTPLPLYYQASVINHSAMALYTDTICCCYNLVLSISYGRCDRCIEAFPDTCAYKSYSRSVVFLTQLCINSYWHFTFTTGNMMQLLTLVSIKSRE